MEQRVAGHKLDRVPLKTEQSGGLVFLGVPGCELRSVSLIGGPDFDSVGVTVWSYRILLESGGPGHCSPAPVTLHWKSVRLEMRKLSFCGSRWILGATLF